MSLIRWVPFEEMDNLFGRLGDVSGHRVGLDLSVDVYEENGHVVAEMHIPGIDPKKLDIEVDGELLKIAGSREDKKEKTERNFFSSEIRYGTFERIVTLPKKVVSDKTKASYTDGVLKVSMPIENVLKRKKISVE